MLQSKKDEKVWSVVIVNEKQRFASFDCLKWFAICAVVLGHFVDQGTGVSKSYRVLFIVIYSFHMPLFVFLSGLFDRKRDRFPLNSILYYLSVGMLLKVVICGIKGLKTGELTFSLLSEVDIPWYLFSLAAWKAAAYFLKDSSPVFVLPLSIAVALLIGYDNSCSDYLCISRTLVFFPFYYVGFFLAPQQVLDLLHKRCLAIAGLLIMSIWVIVCISHIDCIYQFRPLFTGRNPYSLTSIDHCGWLHRLMCYLISGTLCASLVSIFSYIANASVAKLGTKTLAVYFWHWPIALLLIYAGVPDLLLGHYPGGYAWIAIGMIVALVCSTRLFSSPLEAIKRAVFGGG